MAGVYAEPSMEDANTQFIRSTIESFMRINRIPGMAVELYLNGVPHSYYFGYANLRQRSLVNSSTIFEIGSITKVFTSVVAAEELQQGGMRLSDAITRYLPDFDRSKLCQRISIENLATHTSSLPFNAPAYIQTREQLIGYLTYWQPQIPVGSHWLYSNMALGLLGYALEDATHEDYDQFYGEKLLAPLGMANVGVVIKPEYMPYFAQGYNTEGRAVLPSKLGLFPGAWAIKASGRDMLHFLSASIGLPGTPSQILTAMRTTQTARYKMRNIEQGFAWEIHELIPQNMYAMLHEPYIMHVGPFPASHLFRFTEHFNGDALIDKTGSMSGFRAYIGVIPNRKTGIVLMANREVSNGMMMDVGRTILFRLNNII